MNSVDKRIEELLNRAGQTISDLPRKQGVSVSEPYSGKECMKANGTAWRWYLNVDTDMDDYDNSTRSEFVLKLYILHLTDIIDRMEWALENVLNLKDRHVHIVSNVDAPEGLTQEQYFKAAEAIIDAIRKYRVDLEPWDDWSVDDD